MVLLLLLLLLLQLLTTHFPFIVICAPDMITRKKLRYEDAVLALLMGVIYEVHH
jgi:hypothetical protein